MQLDTIGLILKLIAVWLQKGHQTAYVFGEGCSSLGSKFPGFLDLPRFQSDGNGMAHRFGSRSSQHSEQTHRKTKRKTPTKKKVAKGDKLIKLPSF